jgi:hypothetical protein
MQLTEHNNSMSTFAHMTDKGAEKTVPSLSIEKILAMLSQLNETFHPIRWIVDLVRPRVRNIATEKA